MTPRSNAVHPLLLVNADHPIPNTTPPELACPDPRFPEVKLERQAAESLTACIQAVGGQKDILPVSGWRSQEEQQAIWNDTLAKEGEKFTRQYVALPGCSEHQTGLAIDLGLTADEIDFIRPEFPDDGVCGAFRQRAAEYGFVLRYPAGKESVTGIAHEPWHFRYVGISHARIMTDLALTLEEYVALLRRDYAREPLRFRAGPHTFQIQYFREGDWSDAMAEPGLCCQRSEDNCGGVVVTTWR